MKTSPVRVLAALLFLSPSLLTAQDWAGGNSGNVFNVAANWSPSGVPTSGANLTFGATSFNFVGFPGGFDPNSLTFTSAAPKYSLNGNNVGTLAIGAGGLTTTAGGLGVDINSGLQVSLAANQTWTIGSGANVTTQGIVSGAGSLTKEGTGYLVMNGNNSYSGGTTVNAGALYLGQTNSGSGTVTVGSGGTLGAANGDLVLTNAVTLASGATLGGNPFNNESHVELNGAVTIADPTFTLNVAAKSDAFFGGTIGAANPTAMTVQGSGTGVAIMNGTQSNITSVTANNAAVIFGKATNLPTTQIHATNGGYVSVGKIGTGTPAVTDFMNLITNKAGFSGVLGFDTDDDAVSPHTYADNISLAGFTNGQVRIGSMTSAVLTGTITPVAQSYDFGGYAAQDGLLVIKSTLADNVSTTALSLVSPTASGGAPQNGMVLALQGTNSFTGDISVSYGSLFLDSAISGTTDISLGAYAYAGYTENAGFTDFGDFASRVTSVHAGGTSILGIDSHDALAKYVDGSLETDTHTITGGEINLSAYNSVYLGTLTGATISSTTVITTPTDNTLRFVNMGDSGALTINRVLNHSGAVVAGMDGSEGAVVFAVNNSYTGGTSLLGGTLLIGNTTTTALGSGALTVAATTGDMSDLGVATGSATLANNITLNGPLEVGTGETSENTQRYLAGTTELTLSGIISGTGQLHVTGVTTLSGANTYSGGTFLRADTTVSNNTGLGSGNVYVGSKDTDSDNNSGNGTTPVKATLTFTTTAPSIGSLSDASQFVFQGGSGYINMDAASTTLTVNQTTAGTYSGQFLGESFTLVKTGGQQLTLTGANAGQLLFTTISAGSLAIGNSTATTASYDSDIAVNATGVGTGLFFRPGGSQTMIYDGSISGAGNVTVNGNGGATTQIAGGNSSFTGNTTVQAGKLHITGDNFWSANSTTSVQGGATLQLDGNQTIKDLNGLGTVMVAGTKILTVNSVAGSTFSGVITGAGGLTKTGAATTFTLNGGNTYTGNTTVSGGTLIVNSSLFSSPIITVDAGATLMGTGALNDLMLNGTYRPGLSNAAASTSQDNLTMGSTGLLHMELGGTVRGTGYDGLNIANAFAVDGTLSVTFINAFNPTTGATFNLFDFASLTGTFDTLNLQALTAGLSWDTSALYTTGVLSVTGTAIPEPSTYAMFAGLAVLGLAVWRRRAARVRPAVLVTARL